MSVLDYSEIPTTDSEVCVDDPDTQAKIQNQKKSIVTTVPKGGFTGPGKTVMSALIEVPTILGDAEVLAIRTYLQSQGVIDFQITGTIVTKNISGYGSKITSSIREIVEKIPEAIAEE